MRLEMDPLYIEALRLATSNELSSAQNPQSSLIKAIRSICSAFTHDILPSRQLITGSTAGHHFPAIPPEASHMSSSESTSATGSPGVRSRASSQSSLSTFSDHAQVYKPNGPGHEQLSQPGTCPVRHIVFVGAGYVGKSTIVVRATHPETSADTITGGPTAAVLAYCNPKISVTVVDMNQERISMWRSQHLPIDEPGLSDIVRIARDGANAADGEESRDANLFFSNDCASHIAVADIIYLSVNTPTKLSGIGAGAATDISMFESAARSVALSAKPGAIIVEKSTVPCRTADVIREIVCCDC
jgi:UDPglucose 6-dehydrogenase